MKKIIVFIILLTSSISPLKAQIYTPAGTIQGNSGNNNVGIGIDNPLANLHIKYANGSSSAFLRLESLNTGQNASTQYVSDGVWRWELGTGISSGTSFELYDRVNNKSSLVIKEGGFVGVGTTAPEALFDVNGKAIVRSSFYVNDIRGFDGGNVTIGPNTGGASSTIFMIGGVDASEAMRVNYDKNIGIGTTAPTEKLEIYNSDTTPGVISLKSFRNDFSYVDVGRISAKQASVEVSRIGMPRAGGTNTGYLTFWTKADNAADLTEKVRITENGNVGIGTTSPSAKLEIIGFTSNVNGYVDGHVQVVGQDPIAFIGQSNLNPSLNRWGIRLRETGDGDFSIRDNTNNLTRLLIKSTGNVGIGTTTPDARLTVNGNIHAKEVKIDLSVPAPDYVFAPDYKLKTLQEVEDYIKKNNHLPEIPSAAAFEKNGVMLAEMNMSLLKKMEEMTLYMIEQQKKLEMQNKTIEMQSKILEALTMRLNSLEKR